MAAKKKKKRNRPKKRNAPEWRESPAVEMLTVAWVLTGLMGLVCNVAMALARLYLHFSDDPGYVGILAALLLFAACSLGVLSLIMVGPVIKLRRERPPTGLIVFSIVIAVAPITVAIYESL